MRVQIDAIIQLLDFTKDVCFCAYLQVHFVLSYVSTKAIQVTPALFSNVQVVATFATSTDVCALMSLMENGKPQVCNYVKRAIIMAMQYGKMFFLLFLMVAC